MHDPVAKRPSRPCPRRAYRPTPRRGRSVLIARRLLAALLLFPIPAAAQPALSLSLEGEVQTRRIIVEGPLTRHFGEDRLLGEARFQRLLARVTAPVGRGVTVFARAGGAYVEIPQFDGLRAGPAAVYGGGITWLSPPLSTQEPWRIFATADALIGQASARVMSTDCVAHDNCRAGTARPRAGDEEVAWVESTLVLGGRIRRGAIEPRLGLRLSSLTGRDRLTLSPDARFPVAEVLEADLRQETGIGFLLGADILLDERERTVLQVEGRVLDVSGGAIGLRVGF